MENNDMIMSPGEVSALLDVKESTLRKYALILKEAGYHFHVNDKGQRWYYNRDVIAIKKLMDIKQSPDMTLEQAANAVVSWYKQTNVTLPITKESQNVDRYGDDIKELKEVIKVLVQKMDEQQKHNEERVHKLEQKQQLLEQPNEKEKARLDHHDKLLMESIRESQESKKMFREIQEQISQIAATQEEQKKKSFWWSRLLGK